MHAAFPVTSKCPPFPSCQDQATEYRITPRPTSRALSINAYSNCRTQIPTEPPGRSPLSHQCSLQNPLPFAWHSISEQRFLLSPHSNCQTNTSCHDVHNCTPVAPAYPVPSASSEPNAPTPECPSSHRPKPYEYLSFRCRMRKGMFGKLFRPNVQTLPCQ